MNAPIAVLLLALTAIGIGLFVRAWVRGMNFGERLDERQRATREQEAEEREGAADGDDRSS
jgi:hypothetical protein